MKGGRTVGKIWGMCMMLAAGRAFLTGRTGESASALLTSGTEAVSLMLTLLATMTLWSGLLEIMSESGDADCLGRGVRKLMKPLFADLADEKAWNAITMNLTANLLGLGNAATPAGIEAAKRLAGLGPAGMKALAMLLALDNASLQLLPATVITLRKAAGSANPADVWGMTLLISGAASLAAAIMMKIQAGGKRWTVSAERQ